MEDLLSPGATQSLSSSPPPPPFPQSRLAPLFGGERGRERSDEYDDDQNPMVAESWAGLHWRENFGKLMDGFIKRK